MSTPFTCLIRYETNTTEEGLVSTSEYIVCLDKDGIKARDLDCNWEWESSVHCADHNDKCEEKDYLVTLHRFFDASANVEASVKFYEEGEGDGNPYAWCFYNSKDRLIYKYIINLETYSDISLYDELLEIDNKELNSLLIKYEDHNEIFDNLGYKQAL